MSKKNMIALAITFTLTLLSGCANLPSPNAMRAATANYEVPKLPTQDNAMIYVVRPNSLGGLIRFNVFLDDQEAASEMGYTRSSQYIYFSVPAGEHTIWSKAENWAAAYITVKPGDILFIQQEPTLGIIMARNNIFKLEDYQGKYYVKTLSLGTIIKTEK